MFRKIVIGVGVTLVLLLVVAVALIAFIDVNRFKPQIAEAVFARYQRTLVMDGDLSLSLFPRLAIALPATTLSEPGNQTVAAKVGSARLAVAVMPLLSSRIEVEQITLDGVDARIERRKDGRLSIDDLIGGTAAGGTAAGQAGDKPAPGQKPAPAPEPSAGQAGLPAIDIGGVVIRRARVVFDDRTTGNTATISDVDLETGRIADGETTPVSLRFSAATTKPAAKVDTTLKTRLTIRTSAAAPAGAATGTAPTTALRITLADLDLKAGGETDGRPFEAHIVAPRLELGAGPAQAEALTATLKLDGSAQSPQRIALNLKTPVAGDPAAGQWRLAPLAGELLVEDPALSAKPVTIGFGGSIEADTARETAAADLAVTLDGTAAKLKAGVRGFERPRITAALNADRLDLDRLLPPAPAGAAGSGSGQTNPGGGKPVGAAGGGSAADTPIDLTALDALDLDGQVRIGELKARGLVATDLAVDLKAAGGQLRMAPIAASLYQGKLAGSVTAKSGSNQTRAELALTGVSIGPLLVALSGRDLLEGKGELRTTLNTAGPTVDALKRGLNGQAALNLADGAIKGINLAETIRNARNLLQGGSAEKHKSDSSRKTDFTSLAVSFTVANGVASSNDLDVRSPLFRIGGEGRVDLPADRIDYTVKASVVGSSTGQGGKDLEQLRGVTIPVRLSGPLAEPDWQIDWATAGREALKSRAAEELKERLKADPRVNELEDKVRERAGDALRGLFKR